MFSPPAHEVSSGFYVVATPIGNLRDITLRALDVLSAANLILVEDTRVSAKLLNAYGIKASLVRCDEHTEKNRVEEVIKRLHAGEVIALISDAGTPLISDPGFRLIDAVTSFGLKAIPIPGASSVLAALCVSGLPTNQFLFAGFSPPKTKARISFFQKWRTVEASLIFFESGPRLQASLRDMLAIFGNRKAVVAREITKRYETFEYGFLDSLIDKPSLTEPKGELVVVIAPPLTDEADYDEEAWKRELELSLVQVSAAEASKSIAKLYGLNRGVVYQEAMRLKQNRKP
jgi:16S rRNA (cytidine1402-2'-O)-methyltransferase